MHKTNGCEPGVALKAVGGAAGLAGTLVRLSAGFVAFAFLGFLLKDLAMKRKKHSSPALADQ